MPLKKWTCLEELELLGLTVAGKCCREIADRLGKTVTSIRSKRRVMGICQRKRWTRAEKLIVRKHYTTKTAEQIAAMLPGRPRSSIHQLARKLGLPRKWNYVPEGTRDRIRELHAQKKTDQEIADELKMDRRYISSLRAQLGLKVHQDRLLERRLQGIKTQRLRLGIKCPADLRDRAYRRYAIEHGLPAHLRFRAVQVAYCLARNGPSTRRQICEKLNLRWNSSRQNGLCANGNWVKTKKRDQRATYLSELMEEGIVVKLNRALSTGRRGGNVSIYDLTPEWRERITAHVEQKQFATGTAGSAAS